jgi:P4 family phage/plasmid primase-like protien
MLEWALRYIRLGWPVIPLRGKLPLTEHGSKDATLNESQARAWWEKWPQANVGVATGHRFFVIDVDVKSGGEEAWDMFRAQHGALPDTIEQITGTGGKHILYALPDFPVQNSQGKVGPGIDIRGSGGYIVVSPSIHPETKRRYDWDGLAEIEAQKIAPAPGWLLRLLQATERRGPAPEIPQKIQKGQQHSTLVSIAGSMRRRGLSADEIFAALRVINRDRCTEPGTEADIRGIADRVARYPPDARVNLFGEKHPSREVHAEELPLGQADIEAAVENAIQKNDLVGAVELVEHIAKLGPAARLLIKTKLAIHFGKEFPDKDFDRTVKELALGRGGGSGGRVIQMPPPEGGPPPAGPMGTDLLSYPWTDSGNGERVVALFSEDVRYCIEMQRWLVWDGRRWAVDDPHLVTQKVKQMARLLHAQGTGDKSLEKWARASESQAGISASLKRASTEKGIPVYAAELDQHPYLLNCLNGVVDLRTGELLPHDRGYLITKMCHVQYDQTARCPRFLKFLHWAMGDNPDSEMTQATTRLIAFLQRAFGYSLTADVSEKAVFVFWGPKGNNGKTTLLTLFRTMLSEYSSQISIDTLMTTRNQDAALRADMADLRGARLVTTSEVEKEHKLSEGKLKYITAGMGKIKSCRKYENPIEFDATHKIFMDCNHRPAVRGQDDAIWRRLKLVSFEVSITENDPDFDKKLLEKLLAEAAGILAWAVRGCKWWIEEGLGEPPEISQANVEWREHDDPLKEFLEDCCEVEDEAWCRSAELSDVYAWWCKREHERYPLGREAFGERIRAKGFQASRSRRSADGKQMRTYEGVRVREEVSRQMSADGGSHRSLLAD